MGPFRYLVVLVVCAAPALTSASVEDEMRKLKNQVLTLTDEVAALKTRSVHASQTQVAFSARLPQATSVNADPVLFGLVDLNIGGGYDALSGHFTAPVDGTYFFTIYGNPVGGNGLLYIKKNGQILCSTFMDDSDNSKGICSVTAALTTSDIVTVTGSGAYSLTVQGGETGFVGHIVWAQ